MQTITEKIGQKLKIGIKDDEEPYVLITAFIQ